MCIYIHAYIHTYIKTYIHTYKVSSVSFKSFRLCHHYLQILDRNEYKSCRFKLQGARFVFGTVTFKKSDMETLIQDPKILSFEVVTQRSTERQRYPTCVEQILLMDLASRL